MEFIAYCLIYLLMIFFIFFPGIVKERFFFIFWLIIAVSLSFIIRSTIGEGGIQTDIEGYVISMQQNTVDHTYFLREFIFWFGSRYLYNIFGDPSSVFVILDIIFYLFLYKGISLNKEIFTSNIKTEDIRYIFFGVLLFFPFVLGMHNVYRQVMATAIFMTTIGYFSNIQFKNSFFSFLLAFFIHNSVILFIGSIFIFSKKNIYKIFAFVSTFFGLIVSSIVINLTSGWFRRITSEISVGENIAYLYIGVLFSIIIAIIFFERFSKEKKFNSLIYFFSILFVIYSYSAFTLTSLAAERVVLYVFALMFPFLAFYCEDRFNPKIMIRLIFSHLSIAPLFILYNSTIDLLL